MKPNVALLRKAVEWVEEQEALDLAGLNSEWNQEVWAAYQVKLPTGEIAGGRGVSREYACGTTYCVAGKVAEWAGWDVHGYLADLDDPDFITEDHPASIAARELGLNTPEASRLFWHSNTAADVRRIAEEIADEPL